MAITQGMNVEAIRAIASKLDGQSRAIQNVIGQVESAINQSQNDWRGNDAKQFAEEWRGQYKKDLQTLEQALSHLAKSARDNAQQQDEISR